MHIFNFLYPFTFTYFICFLDSCNGKDAKQHVFVRSLLVAVKRAGCIVCQLSKVPVLVV